MLDYLVRSPKQNRANPPLVLMLHGFGGNEQDLFAFAERFPDKYLVVSLRAPLSLGPGSYAWFHVDFSSGSPVINPGQADKSRQLVIRFLADLKQEVNYDGKDVNLIGFSQGGIMAYSVSLTEPEKINSVTVVNGLLLPHVKPLIASRERLKSLKVFIAHGKNDMVIRHQFAVDAREYLESLGLKPGFRSYDEGHYISERMLEDIINTYGPGRGI